MLDLHFTITLTLYQAETTLLRTIISEARHGQRLTCILYPSAESMLLPDFVTAARSFGTASSTSCAGIIVDLIVPYGKLSLIIHFAILQYILV